LRGDFPRGRAAVTPRGHFAQVTGDQLRASLDQIRARTAHGPSVGAGAEKVLRSWLESHLPGAFAVSHGELVDSDDRRSLETDVVVLRRDLHPQLYVDGQPSLFMPSAVH